jgi:hypothetical protein
MIGIGGLARAGKDTLASDLSEIIKADMGVDVKIFSLAWPVKWQLNDLFESYYHLSPFTEDTEEKKIIRPIMVAHGEQMKQKFGKDIWLKELLGTIHEDLRYKEFFPIISDVRFDFEVEAIKNENGQVIHISKIGNLPPNEIEALNDPLVAKEADLNHTWPAYNSDQVDKCMDHAHILWQMLKQTHEEKWKKTYT